MSNPDTIAAIASPQGQGGVGIIRISGDKTKAISKALIGQVPKPRFAKHAQFKNAAGQIIDDGLALFFQGPNSFTGEDILELQGHGSPIVQDQLLQEIIKLGARLARPGEFSERAFLNDKIDLVQAEAIADLIAAQSQQAARAAIRSLQGEFSKGIHQLVEGLIYLRTYVEAAIDFPEEEVDFLGDNIVSNKLDELNAQLSDIKAKAKQGNILQEGLHIVLAGKPNAGKSSLLNCLTGYEAAIVTDIPGTTRDIVREHINLDGIPIKLFDTAGLRSSDDIIEQQGINRALDSIQQADLILLVIDSEQADDYLEQWQDLPEDSAKIIVFNKTDLLSSSQLDALKTTEQAHALISTVHNKGFDDLTAVIKQQLNFNASSDGEFIARRRHLQALDTAWQHLQAGIQQLTEFKAGELLAEELRLAQQALGEITGEFHSDDLLGEIFSSFCIGK